MIPVGVKVYPLISPQQVRGNTLPDLWNWGTFTTAPVESLSDTCSDVKDLPRWHGSVKLMLRPPQSSEVKLEELSRLSYTIQSPQIKMDHPPTFWSFTGSSMCGKPRHEAFLMDSDNSGRTQTKKVLFLGNLHVKTENMWYFVDNETNTTTIPNVHTYMYTYQAIYIYQAIHIYHILYIISIQYTHNGRYDHPCCW